MVPTVPRIILSAADGLLARAATATTRRTDLDRPAMLQLLSGARRNVQALQALPAPSYSDALRLLGLASAALSVAPRAARQVVRQAAMAAAIYSAGALALQGHGPRYNPVKPARTR